MPLSASELARLGRMAGESHKAAADRLVDDTDLQDIADEVAQVVDSAGLEPDEAGYTETYDLYMAAAETWRQKAGIVAEQFDFESEGGVFSRSQAYEMYMKQATRYAGMAAQLSPVIARSEAAEEPETT